MTPSAEALLALMQTGLPQVGAFITTVMADGTPTTRQVAPYVSDAWVIELLSRRSVFKVAHIRRQPRVSLFWVELAPTSPARTVLVQGTATIVEDAAGLAEFYARREAATGRPEKHVEGRCVIRVQPDFLRAERFSHPNRSHPVLIRDFSTLELIQTNDPVSSPRD